MTEDEIVEAAVRADYEALDKAYPDALLPLAEHDEEAMEAYREQMRAVVRAVVPLLPPVVTTAEEIDALPTGTVLLSRKNGGVWERCYDGWFGVREIDEPWPVSQILAYAAEAEDVLTVAWIPKEKTS